MSCSKNLKSYHVYFQIISKYLYNSPAWCKQISLIKHFGKDIEQNMQYQYNINELMQNILQLFMNKKVDKMLNINSNTYMTVVRKVSWQSNLRKNYCVVWLIEYFSLIDYRLKWSMQKYHTILRTFKNKQRFLLCMN